MPIMTGLSGNEIYCLHLQKLAPGDIVVGNSVFSVGFLGGIGSGFRTLVGGEVDQVTSIIHEGRAKCCWSGWCTRPRAAAGWGSRVLRASWSSTRGMWSSPVHRVLRAQGGASEGAKRRSWSFPASADGQELYCQMDAGFRPLKFAFGNVAYSIGIGGGIAGSSARPDSGRGCRVFQHLQSDGRHSGRLQRIYADAQKRGGELGRWGSKPRSSRSAAYRRKW